jgi:hypothetical protein
MIKQTRRESKRLCCCLGVLLVLFTTGRATALDKVVIAHSTQLSATIAPLLYGIHRGFFKDQFSNIECCGPISGSRHY